MSSVPLFVGLDYHDDEVQVCVLDESGGVVLNRKCENNAARIQAAVNARGLVRRVAIESCCGAASLADELIARGGWPVQLAHPGYVARMKHTRDKTDRQDAQVLADLARVNYLPQVWLAPEAVRQLRRLVRYRQTLVDDRRDVKLRIRALLREKRLKCPLATSPWTKAWIAWVKSELSWSEDDRWLIEQHFERLAQLTAQVAAAEKRLAERTVDDPLVKKLLTLEGVGLITAVTLRAEIGRVDRFQNGKQMARYCGLTPRNASSGQRGRRLDPRRQSATARGADRTSAAPDVARQERVVALANARVSIAKPWQAAQRRRGRRGQSLGALAVPRSAAAACAARQRGFASRDEP
jgi:transposase